MARRRGRRIARKVASGAASLKRRLEKHENLDLMVGSAVAGIRGYMAKEGKQLPTPMNIDADLLYGLGMVAGSKFARGKSKEWLAAAGKPMLYFGIAGWVRSGGYQTTDQAAGLFVPGVGGRPPYGWSEVVSGEDDEEDLLLSVDEEGDI